MILVHWFNQTYIASLSCTNQTKFTGWEMGSFGIVQRTRVICSGCSEPFWQIQLIREGGAGKILVVLWKNTAINACRWNYSFNTKIYEFFISYLIYWQFTEIPKSTKQRFMKILWTYALILRFREIQRNPCHCDYLVSLMPNHRATWRWGENSSNNGFVVTFIITHPDIVSFLTYHRYKIKQISKPHKCKNIPHTNPTQYIDIEHRAYTN